MTPGFCFAEGIVQMLSFVFILFFPENDQRAHSPLLAPGLASELKIGKKSLNLGDSLSRLGGTAGFFNTLQGPDKISSTSDGG